MFKKKGDQGENAFSKAVGGVVQENKTRPLYNKVFRLPTNIVKEINQFIDQGYKGRAVCKVMEKYKNKYDIPTPETMRKYISWYLNKKNKEPEVQLKELVTRDSVGNQSELANIDYYAGKDKKDILEDLIFRIDKRMRLIEQKIKGDPDYDFDRVLAGYMKEVRMILETLAKLSGELHDEKTTIINIVRNQTDIIFQWFNDTLRRIVPDKAEEIQGEVLKRIEQFTQPAEEKSNV